MDNIYLIPTNKKTYLHKSTSSLVLRKQSAYVDDMKQAVRFHVYVVSNKKIKPSNWCLNIVTNTIFKPTEAVVACINNSKKKYYDYFKPIILTTDRDLINDGIQAVGDVFLAWFIKNPTCSLVDVKRIANGVNNHNLTYEYQIIIPTVTPDIYLEKGVVVNDLSKQKIDNYSDLPKQETLEVAAEKLFGKLETGIGAEKRRVWINGAKWRQEKTKEAITLLKQTTEYEVLESFRRKVDLL